MPNDPVGEEAEFEAGFYGDEFARFEALGEASTSRLLFSGGLAAPSREAALIWLGRKSREAAAAREVIDREDRAIANSAKDAAWEQAREARRANARATVLTLRFGSG